MIEADRLISAGTTLPEDVADRAIRPKLLEEYVGQPQVRSQMEIFHQSSETARRCPRSSVDFSVLRGWVKLRLPTSSPMKWALIYARLLVRCWKRRAIWQRCSLTLNRMTCCLLMRSHRLSPVVEEVLYPAMEDYQLDIMIGEGPAARSIKIDLPPFTLIGATTRAGSLTSPLRDRFGIVQRLEFYQVPDLQYIVSRSARFMGLEMSDDGALEVARRARGTPRIANRLLRRVRDFAEVKHDGTISADIAAQALDMLNVDAEGFDYMDRKLLLAVIDKFFGGPVGLDNLAAAIGEERETIEDVLEPYLIQQGFLQRTPRGRMATTRRGITLA